MGATIFFKQLKPKDRQDLEVDAPSLFIEAMRTAFGDPPWRLTAEEIPVLRGMAAMPPLHPNPYRDLIDAVERLNEIEVWPEW